MPEITYKSVAAIKKGIPTDKIIGVTSKVLIKAGIPSTTNPLNKLEPKIFPKANASFPFLAAEIETKISGKDVPIATAVRAITAVPIFKISDILTTDSIA